MLIGFLKIKGFVVQIQEQWWGKRKWIDTSHQRVDKNEDVKYMPKALVNYKLWTQPKLYF